MKLLIYTQVVDPTHSNLGFFTHWIEEFATHCEKVTVVCLGKGEYSLPSNVEVYSLGKEEGTSRFVRMWRFYKYLFKLQNEFDAVFVHMNPEYIVLGGYFFKKWHKKVSLWYAHRSDTYKLRRALNYVDYVFTVSGDSFMLPTPKLRAMGHGIDVDAFKPRIKEESTHLRIATVGRIANSKHIIEMLGVLNELYLRKENFEFSIIGSPLTDTEKEYAVKLSEVIEKAPWKKNVHLLGPMAHVDLPDFLNTQDVFFNFASTGNMDKAGLEALASGMPLLATNPQFEPMLAPYGLYVPGMDPVVCADALLAFFERPDQPAILATLRNKVVAEHSLSSLIPRILSTLTS
jgi:glycosyltransferase involved in cell wall biosynthesis